jgi:hypothetical protein
LPKNPRGPKAEDSFDPLQAHLKIPRKVLKAARTSAREITAALSASRAFSGTGGYVNFARGVLDVFEEIKN